MTPVSQAPSEPRTDGAWGESALPLTRASGMAPLVAFLDSLGAPTARLLREVRIPPALLEEGEALVPLHLVHRFVEIAARWTDVENLGAALGQQTCAYDLGAFGQRLARAVTVYDYLQTGARLISSVSSGARFWLTREREQVRFHHFQPGSPGPGRDHSDLYALAVTIGMLRSFLGADWRPQQVRLLASNARMIGDGAVFGDTEICLNQSHSSFAMPLATLQRAIPAALRSRSERAAVTAALKPDMPSGFLDRVESLITSLLMADSLDVEILAEAAGTSTRTLQRQLQAYGLSYSAIVQQTRLGLACDWLSGTGMLISEISAVLGYADPAHFSRAFRRKSGMTPQQYRNQHR